MRIIDGKPEYKGALVSEMCHVNFDKIYTCMCGSKHLSCAQQKGPSMMTRYARSYSLQKGPSIEDSVE